MFRRLVKSSAEENQKAVEDSHEAFLRTGSPWKNVADESIQCVWGYCWLWGLLVRFGEDTPKPFLAKNLPKAYPGMSLELFFSWKGTEDGFSWGLACGRELCGASLSVAVLGAFCCCVGLLFGRSLRMDELLIV